MDNVQIVAYELSLERIRESENVNLLDIGENGGSFVNILEETLNDEFSKKVETTINDKNRLVSTYNQDLKTVKKDGLPLELYGRYLVGVEVHKGEMRDIIDSDREGHFVMPSEMDKDSIKDAEVTPYNFVVRVSNQDSSKAYVFLSKHGRGASKTVFEECVLRDRMIPRIKDLFMDPVMIEPHMQKSATRNAAEKLSQSEEILDFKFRIPNEEETKKRAKEETKLGKTASELSDTFDAKITLEIEDIGNKGTLGNVADRLGDLIPSDSSADLKGKVEDENARYSLDMVDDEVIPRIELRMETDNHGFPTIPDFREKVITYANDSGYLISNAKPEVHKNN